MNTFFKKKGATGGSQDASTFFRDHMCTLVAYLFNNDTSFMY